VIALVFGVAGAQGAPGALDGAFGSGGKVLTDFSGSSADSAGALMLQPNKKIVAAGSTDANGTVDFALARYKQNGVPDTLFDGDGKVITGFGLVSSDVADGVAVQIDEKIVAAGYSDANGSNDFALVRYMKDGSLDSGFGSGGKVLTDLGILSADFATGVAVQSDGKIVVVGYSNANGSNDLALVRYKGDGTLDSTFGSGGIVLTDLGLLSEDFGYAIALQDDDKIVVAGYSDKNGSDDFAVARYKPNGTLDDSFSSDGVVLTNLGSSSTDRAYAVAIQGHHDKILVAGTSDANGSDDFAVVRYKTDGNASPGFGGTGKVLVNFGGSSTDVATAVLVQENGQYVIAGRSNAGGSSDFALARITKDGLLNPGFGSGGKVLTNFGGSSSDAANAAALQPADGKILTAGVSDKNGSNDFALARYIGTTPGGK
jgi:uncharacterized delta-60 repeat protein